MEEMFFEEPPPFESIIETLDKLEHEINDKKYSRIYHSGGVEGEES